MADGRASESSDFEDGQKGLVKVKSRTKLLKHNLEEWREVMLPLNSILMWERSFDPAVILGVITSIFVLLWFLEPSILTTFSVLGIIVCFVDYLIPTLSGSLFDPNKWTGDKQQKFEDICNGMAKTSEQLLSLQGTLNNLKETKPKIYFITVLSFLVTFAWIGNLIDNLLLTYLIVSTTAMLPGLKHRGIFSKCIASSYKYMGLNKKKTS